MSDKIAQLNETGKTSTTYVLTIQICIENYAFQRSIY